MRRVVIALILGSCLAGCATHTARTDEQGYASPGVLPGRAEQTQVSDKERSQAWSAREFSQPRGLWW